MTRNEGERLAGLEAKVDIVIEDLSDLKNNHLPHIEERLDGLSKWIIRLLVTANFLLLGALVAALFK